MEREESVLYGLWLYSSHFCFLQTKPIVTETMDRKVEGSNIIREEEKFVG